MAVPRSSSSWRLARAPMTIASILTVTLDTTAVKRYTTRPALIFLKVAGAPAMGAEKMTDRIPPNSSATSSDSVFSALAARRARWLDGARAGRRQEVAGEGRDARGHRGLPVLTRTTRHPGRHLDFLHPGQVLGAWAVAGRSSFPTSSL